MLLLKGRLGPNNMGHSKATNELAVSSTVI